MFNRRQYRREELRECAGLQRNTEGGLLHWGRISPLAADLMSEHQQRPAHRLGLTIFGTIDGLVSLPSSPRQLVQSPLGPSPVFPPHVPSRFPVFILLIIFVQFVRACILIIQVYCVTCNVRTACISCCAWEVRWARMDLLII